MFSPTSPISQTSEFNITMAQDNSFSTTSTLGTTATAATTATPDILSPTEVPFKPTSFIPHMTTLTKKQVDFKNNVTNLARFYEEHQHYTVPKSNKKLFQFCKNMKSAIRGRKEGITIRTISDTQYKILLDIKFIEHTLYLDKSTKQNPVTKSFRSLMVHIDDFKKQNGHLDIFRSDATYTKKVRHSDRSSEEIDMIETLRTSLKVLTRSRVGMERKNKLKEKGLDLDAITIRSESRNRNHTPNDDSFGLILNNRSVEITNAVGGVVDAHDTGRGAEVNDRVEPVEVPTDGDSVGVTRFERDGMQFIQIGNVASTEKGSGKDNESIHSETTVTEPDDDEPGLIQHSSPTETRNQLQKRNASTIATTSRGAKKRNNANKKSKGKGAKNTTRKSKKTNSSSPTKSPAKLPVLSKKRKTTTNDTKAKTRDSSKMRKKATNNIPKPSAAKSPVLRRSSRNRKTVA